MIAFKVIFSGRVRGVSFRLTAWDFAKDYQVFGKVSNKPNDTVEMFVEGEEDEVEEYLDTLRRRMSGNVREMRTTPMNPMGFDRFVIVNPNAG
jgi:acylphosphatase